MTSHITYGYAVDETGVCTAECFCGWAAVPSLSSDNVTRQVREHHDTVRFARSGEKTRGAKVQSRP